MKTSRQDAIKRDTYFTVAVLLCSKRETACVKPNAILSRERNDDDGGRIEIISKCRNKLTSVDSSIVKGPIRLRDSRSQNLAAGTRSCERLYQALF